MGYNPVDFWRSHPRDYWLVVEAKEEQQRDSDRTRYPGGMTEAQVAEIYEDTYGG